MTEGEIAEASVAAPSLDAVPATLGRRGAARFWLAVLVVGAGAGLLTRLLEAVQRWTWDAAPGCRSTTR